MDKELLRVVIIATGVVIFIGILLWGVFSDKKSRRRVKSPVKRDPLDNIDESLVIKTENDEFDIIPLGSALDDSELEQEFGEAIEGTRGEMQEEFSDSMEEQSDSQTGTESDAATELPGLIQFSIQAADDKGFTGRDLIPALESAGLVYGDLKIFERLDDNNLVDFGVASMVKPGTFPDQDLESFSCPGIVFFMQPREVNDPLVVFDDLVSTIHGLTQQLGGVAQDDQRQALTEGTIDSFRKQMTG